MELWRKYLEEGKKLHKKGDRVQAGEKYYRAVSVLIKMIGEKLGMDHYSHRERRKIIEELDKRYSKEDYHFSSMYGIAEDLHSNFYERYLSNEDFDRKAGIIIKEGGLISRLEKILKTLEEQKP